MPNSYGYDVVDVFTDVPLEGNPLAVFYDGLGLDDSTMQRIARELNLSETTFLLPPTIPDAAIRVRIFTPTRELRFAGHPTVGSAFVARERGLISSGSQAFNLEEPVGPVPVRIDDGTPAKIWLTTPRIAFEDTLPHDGAAAAAKLQSEDLIPGVPCRIVGAGNPFVFLALVDPEAVDRAEIDTGAFDALVARKPQPIGFFVFTPTKAGAYSRMFAPQLGISEDPATGGATGPLAAFMREYDLLPAGTVDFVSEQGTKMGRRSLLHVNVRKDGDDVRFDVGGQVAPIVSATMTIP
jgi:trans-2,3-dihydro-3-hydroxyanthranilate isomerase